VSELRNDGLAGDLAPDRSGGKPEEAKRDAAVDADAQVVIRSIGQVRVGASDDLILAGGLDTARRRFERLLKRIEATPVPRAIKLLDLAVGPLLRQSEKVVERVEALVGTAAVTPAEGSAVLVRGTEIAERLSHELTVLAELHATDGRLSRIAAEWIERDYLAWMKANYVGEVIFVCRWCERGFAPDMILLTVTATKKVALACPLCGRSERLELYARGG
jgi:hypothetical protein